MKMTNVANWKPLMVALHDGTMVPSDSEEWRHECEARAVMNMPTRIDRNRYIMKVAKSRGDEAAHQLRETVQKLWPARSSPAGGGK